MQFNKTLQNIKNYEAGKPIELVMRDYGIDEKDIIKLASNENPYGVSPQVQEVVAKNVSKMYMYPDDSMFELKDALSSYYEIQPDNLIIGSGSDQIIEFAIHAKANKNNSILINSVTFAMYEIYAKQVATKIIRTTQTHHDLDEFYDLYKKHHPAMIFLCTPNNPTGDAIDTQKMMTFLEKIDNETLVVVDGAYMEYASFKDKQKAIIPKELITKFPNVLYLGTFSKAYALGGMRVGYGIADQDIINALYKLRPPFNVTTLSLLAAHTALQDQEFVMMCIKKNFQEMQRYKKFAKENGINFIQSYTNFITLMLKNTQNSSEISNNLLKKGIIVRDLKSYDLNAIRVTIGTRQQNDRFFTEFKKLL